jgi:hypothetical protein
VHEVRVVDVDKKGVFAGVGIASMALPWKNIARVIVSTWIGGILYRRFLECAHLPHPKLMTTFLLGDDRERNCRTTTSIALSLNQ